VDVLENTPRGTSGEKAPLGRILCNFRLRMRALHPRERPSGSHDLRSLRMTLHNVTSGEKAPLGRVLRNFRLCFGKHLSREPLGVTWLSVALSVMRNDTFCTTTIVRKNAGNDCACARDHFRDFLFQSWPLPVTWHPVTWLTSFSVRAASGSTSPQHLLKCGLNRIDILLWASCIPGGVHAILVDKTRQDKYFIEVSLFTIISWHTLYW
jgi:hypothetical protein